MGSEMCIRDSPSFREARSRGDALGDDAGATTATWVNRFAFLFLLFLARDRICDPRVVRTCVSSRARARECEIQHGTSRRHRHSDARPHSDARWRPRSHDPARSAIHFIQLVSDFTILIHVAVVVPRRLPALSSTGFPPKSTVCHARGVLGVPLFSQRTNYDWSFVAQHEH